MKKILFSLIMFGLTFGQFAFANELTGQSFTVGKKAVYGYTGSKNLVGKIIPSDTPEHPVEVMKVVIGNTFVMELIKRVRAEDQDTFRKILERANWKW